MDSDIKKMSSDELARFCIEQCEDRKAENVKLYNVKQTSLLADYYLVCSGNSDPHIRAISNHLQKVLGERGIRATRIDGIPSSHWVVMDYGTVLIHIFHPDTRRYYLLEELWEAADVVYPEPQ